MATLASAIVAPRSDNMTNVARLDADTAWVQGMVEYRQSIVNLHAAEGVPR